MLLLFLGSNFVYLMCFGGLAADFESFFVLLESILDKF
jgi:hypothetical protein